jgi:hypothetical protein
LIACIGSNRFSAAAISLFEAPNESAAMEKAPRSALGL